MEGKRTVCVDLSHHSLDLVVFKRSAVIFEKLDALGKVLDCLLVRLLLELGITAFFDLRQLFKHSFEINNWLCLDYFWFRILRRLGSGFGLFGHRWLNRDRA